jgi:tetratricopeptide (TPR) repeat protein
LLGLAQEQSGDLPDAVKEYEKVHEIEKTNDVGGLNFGLGLLAHGYALQGNRDKARQLLGQLDLEQKKGGISLYTYALAHLALGNKKEAIDWLERSYENRESGVIGNIGVDPTLDPLRGNPRFEALVQRVLGPKANEKR